MHFVCPMDVPAQHDSSTFSDIAGRPQMLLGASSVGTGSVSSMLRLSGPVGGGTGYEPEGNHTLPWGCVDAPLIQGRLQVRFVGRRVCMEGSLSVKRTVEVITVRQRWNA